MGAEEFVSQVSILPLQRKAASVTKEEKENGHWISNK